MDINNILFLSPHDSKGGASRIANYLLDKSDSYSPFTKIPEQLSRLDTLKLHAENDKDDNKSKKLQELDDYLVGMMNDYEKYI